VFDAVILIVIYEQLYEQLYEQCSLNTFKIIKL